MQMILKIMFPFHKELCMGFALLLKPRRKSDYYYDYT